MDIHIIGQMAVSGALMGLVYALIAYGFQLTYATSRSLNFVQGELVMVSATRAVMLSYALSGMVAALAGVLVSPITTVGPTMGAALVLKAEGTTLLRVEPFARTALQVADYAYVMERGVIAVQGTPEQLGRDGRVVEAYLG